MMVKIYKIRIIESSFLDYSWKWEFEKRMKRNLRTHTSFIFMKVFYMFILQAFFLKNQATNQRSINDQ